MILHFGLLAKLDGKEATQWRKKSLTGNAFLSRTSYKFSRSYMNLLYETSKENQQ